jgi:hypothetical protein
MFRTSGIANGVQNRLAAARVGVQKRQYHDFFAVNLASKHNRISSVLLLLCQIFYAHNEQSVVNAR